MGSSHSSTNNRNRNRFFTHLPNFLNRRRNVIHGYRFDMKRIWCSDLAEELCIYSTPQENKWCTLKPHLKNLAIKDFIDTIYIANYSFDDLYDLCASNCLWYLECPHQKNLILSRFDRLRIAEDVLKYAFVNRLQYCHRRGDSLTLENLIDLPLKTFGVCGCSGRPLYVAVYFSRPDIARLLLNCGARIPLEDVCVCGGRKWHPLRNSLSHMKKVLNYETISDTITNYRERCVLCLWTLLVDLPHTSMLCRQVSDVLDEISGDDYAKFEEIPSLKHIARTQIRLYMKSNRSFCKAQVFKELGMPKILVDYINIEESHNYKCFLGMS